MKNFRALLTSVTSLISIAFIIAVFKLALPVKAEANLDISKDDFKRWSILLEKDSENETATYQDLISKQAVKLTIGLNSDREKALAFAIWIAANWRNASENPIIHNSVDSKSMLAKFINRTGKCGTRTKIFNDMAKVAGLKSQRYSIYNFGKVGGGHTAPQVFWDDKWHFFDVTYSGYFEKSGRILSFDEIVKLGDDALNYLVAFDSFGDVEKIELPSSKWKFVDNAQRMSETYSYKNLLKAGSRGFVGEPTPVTLQFSMSPGDFLGSLDKRGRDVFKQGKEKQKSEQLHRMGFSSVPFFQKIILEKLEPGKTYRYQLDIARSTFKKKKWNFRKDAEMFKANSTNCEITLGNTFGNNSGQWVIDVKALTKSCTLNIDHNILKRGKFIVIDKIQFSEL